MESGSHSRGLLLSTASGRWILAPIPKVASTVLKRVAVIADGRTPPEYAVYGETRPALAVHHPDFHCLKPPSMNPGSTADQAALKLLVTRHPGERLLSFWHDKIFLSDPNYKLLNRVALSKSDLDEKNVCDFKTFLLYLQDHWSSLKSDLHLCPQSEIASSCHDGFFRLDRNDLVRQLPILLQPLINQSTLNRIKSELQRYDSYFCQKLSNRWKANYDQESFQILKSLYGADLDIYSYTLKRNQGDTLRKLSACDVDALADPIQQLRDRNDQISDLHQQLISARSELLGPALPELVKARAACPEHNRDEAGLQHLYEYIIAGKGEKVLVWCLDNKSKINDDLVRGECFYIQGLALSILNRHHEALSAYSCALELKFITPFLFFNIGNSHRDLDSNHLAIKFYEQALELNPDFSECRHNFALALKDRGDHAAAERVLRLVLRDHPETTQAAFSLAELLRESHRNSEAVEAYRLCLNYAPLYCEAWNNLGLTYGSLDQSNDAIASYLQALSIDANYPQSRQNLAQAYVQQKRHHDAIDQFKIFSRLNLSPQQQVISVQGEIACYMELDQDNLALECADSFADRRVQLISRLHVLPVLYRDQNHLASTRNRWAKDLRELYDLLGNLRKDDPVWELLYAHTWTISNFYLSYQMEDDRSLQELYAGVLDRILRPRFGCFMKNLERKISKSSSIRVGVISPHLHNHNGSIWALGWLEMIAINRDFEIFSYNTGDKYDSGTQRFADLGCYRHIPLSAENPEPMFQKVIDDELDVLIFTDIGMHPTSKILSVLKLAPVQIQGWGHPITSGSRTMNYYFSGCGMEPPGNEEHYSEILYRLPKTGLNYERPVSLHDGSVLHEKFNLPHNRPLIASLQSTFKYVPSNDWVFAEIAMCNPNALILLVGHMGNGGVVDRLIDRIKPHFVQRGLDINHHLRVLPRLSYEDYLGILCIANHAIDTIDWNGGNSSFQSFSLGCPVVTLPTSFMRGRHTLSMLEVLEIPELVANDPSEYVSISSRLLQDQIFRQDICSKIKDRAHLLFGDCSVAEAFELALVRVVSGKKL